MDLRKPPKLGMLGWISTCCRKILEKGTANNNLYFKVQGDKLLIVVVYVDDIIFGGDDNMCNRFVIEM